MASTIDGHTASIATYVCSAFSATILIARLSVSRFQPKPFDASFWVTLLALLVVLSRVVVSYYVLKYDTVSDALNKKGSGGKLTPHEMENLKRGSILSLVLRLLLTTALWLMCSLLLLLYRRFIRHLPWMKYAITGTWVFIGLSYVGVVLATFLECRPFSLYWQVYPNPGSCIKEYVQITLQAVTNIIIDLILMGISLPIVFVQAQRAAHRLKLIALISLGVFCIIITTLRLAYTFQSSSMQPARTFWASISVLVATFVANAPVLYGAIRLRKREKLSSRSRSYPANVSLRTRNTQRTGQGNTFADDELAIVKHTVVMQTEHMNFGTGESGHSASVEHAEV